MNATPGFLRAVRIAAINDAALHPYFENWYPLMEFEKLKMVPNATLSERQKVERVKRITLAIKEVKDNRRLGMTVESAVRHVRSQSLLDAEAWTLIERLARL